MLAVAAQTWQWLSFFARYGSCVGDSVDDEDEETEPLSGKRMNFNPEVKSSLGTSVGQLCVWEYLICQRRGMWSCTLYSSVLSNVIECHPHTHLTGVCGSPDCYCCSWGYTMTIVLVQMYADAVGSRQLYGRMTRGLRSLRKAPLLPDCSFLLRSTTSRNANSDVVDMAPTPNKANYLATVVLQLIMWWRCWWWWWR